MKFRIHIEQDEDGVFIASCPTLPGCWSQGDTRDQAVKNIQDAIAGYLESLEKHGDAIPPPISEEVIDVPTRRTAYRDGFRSCPGPMPSRRSLAWVTR